jgi:ribonuclease HI
MSQVIMKTKIKQTIQSRIGKTFHHLFSFPEHILYFDGFSRGSLGSNTCEFRAVIYQNTEKIWSEKKICGPKVTKEMAEYNGLLLGLEKAVDMKIKHLVVLGCNSLIIKQMRFENKVLDENVMILATKAKQLEKKFDKIYYYSIFTFCNGCFQKNFIRNKK